MDIDNTSEFRRYLNNSSGFNLQPPPPNRASRASNAGLDGGAAAGGRSAGGGVQPPSAMDMAVEPQDSLMTGATDLDGMVNSSDLRRGSQANVYGVDNLYLGDERTFMHSEPYAAAQMRAAGMMSNMPTTTMEELMEMNATSAELSMFDYGGGMPSGSNMQSGLSMYGDPQRDSITPRSQPSPIVTHLAGGGNSMHQSPVASSMSGSAGGLRPHTLVTRTSSMSIPMSGSGKSQDENDDPTSMDTSLDQDHSVPMSGITPANPPPNDQPQPSKPNSMFPQNIYSSSGFDMLDILHRVATRPNPEINIGAVDMSCAFVVTDVRKFDHPIVYCSATFERLTGYTKHEVLGRNCRFLQAPDGQIKSGEKRRYVDENAVYYLKKQIEEYREAQTSLINYRKGGQSFTNLLTMIPITYDSDEVVYYVGFQVDLVDQPGALNNKNRDEDGSYAVNYQYAQLPTYVPGPLNIMESQRARMSVADRDDVSQVLASFGTGDSELHSKRILDKVLLENTDDVVHVLSLKGLFLYCSPSIRKVLEYEPHELVGTSLSGVCHPSDIVPVTRDLKDTSAGTTTVNVVFRIRRKYSGYTWFESHGCLHTEQGKGRKCIILVGRERPVYALQNRDIQANGGIGENELWTKMSTSGMFLYVSTNVKALLDRESEELVGTSVQALMRSEAKKDLDKALEVARQGKKTNVRHELQNKRGQFLQAVTTLFPGDGGRTSKPTFLVAQTRLLKHSRQSGSSATMKATSATPETTNSSHASTPSIFSATTPSTHPTTGERSNSAESKESEPPAGDDNLFEELKTTRSTSWQFELRQMQRTNKRLTEQLSTLMTNRKKRKRRKGADQLEKDCANCHTRTTPEWRRGPSGKRDLCNSCGLRYAKLQKFGRSSSRNGGTSSDKSGCSPLQTNSPMTMHSLAVELSPRNTPVVTPMAQPQLQSINEVPPADFPNPLMKHEPEGSTPVSPVTGMPSIPQMKDMRRGSMGNIMMAKQQQRRQQMSSHHRRGSVPSSPNSLSTVSSGTATQASHVNNNSSSYEPSGENANI